MPLAAKGARNNLTAFSILRFGHHTMVCATWVRSLSSFKRMSKTAWLDNLSHFCYCKCDFFVNGNFTATLQGSSSNKHTNKSLCSGITVNPFAYMHSDSSGFDCQGRCQDTRWTMLDIRITEYYLDCPSGYTADNTSVFTQGACTICAQIWFLKHVFTSVSGAPHHREQCLSLIIFQNPARLRRCRAALVWVYVRLGNLQLGHINEDEYETNISLMQHPTPITCSWTEPGRQCTVYGFSSKWVSDGANLRKMTFDGQIFRLSNETATQTLWPSIILSNNMSC